MLPSPIARMHGTPDAPTPPLAPQADLADRDFTAERAQLVVISNGTVDPLAEERDAALRREAEDRNRHRLRLPRRPAWNAQTTAEELDHKERTSFLLWRRELAVLEEEERLVLTPFEKNLEVWRQLWRVLERSDIVVQVRGEERREEQAHAPRGLEMASRSVLKHILH
jgi:large subunit GTPase 1